MVKEVVLHIEDEIRATFYGLDQEHLRLFVEAYSYFAPNYFFNPQYKLGNWDGRLRYFTWKGQTYVTLIPEIVPAVQKLGYKLTIQDDRAGTFFKPAPIDENHFSHIKNGEGEPIILRDYQVSFANQLMAAGNGIGVAATSAGKAQPLDAKIMTPDGWKLMGDIKVGSVVTAADGSSALVTGVFPQGVKQIYKVLFSDGTSAESCDEHLWGVYAPVKNHTGKTEYRVMSLKEIMLFLDRKDSGLFTPGSISVPVASPVDWNAHEPIPLPAYSMGALLGDGCLSRQNVLMISSADSHIVSKVNDELTPLGVSLKHRSNYDYGITKDGSQTCPPSPNPIVQILHQCGLMGTTSNSKFIPEVYKRSSLADRHALVQGLMDTDGTIDKRGNVSFSTVSYQLACDLREVIQSIGGICAITSRQPTFTYLGERKQGQVCYQLNTSHPNKAVLFSLPRKVDRCATKLTANKPIRKRIISVTPIGMKEAQCIMIDHADHLYITNDYIVTHNTFLCGAIVDSYQKVGASSMVIVPNTDLIKQTRKEFASIGLETGEYSGKVKETNGKMIVISTWQALKNNPTILTDRDVILVDETHGARGNVLQNLLNNYCAKIPHRFGVTGTMPDHPTENMSVRCSIGPILDTISASQLIERGVLATLDINIMQLKENLTKQYAEYEATYQDAEGNEALVPYDVFKATFFADYASEKKFLFKNEERLQWISNQVQTRRNTGNVLTLVNSVEMGKKLAAITPNSHFVYGDDDDKVREEAYELFKSGDDVVVFATYGIASTGLSINRIHELFLVDIGKSFIRVIQSIGRGLRKAKDKSHVNVWDICSDLPASKKHLTKRKAMYKKAEYPHKVKKVDYSPDPN